MLTMGFHGGTSYNKANNRNMERKPFEPTVLRRAIVTLDNGAKIQAQMRILARDIRFHDDLENSLVEEWNKAQPGAVHKVKRIHLMRN